MASKVTKVDASFLWGFFIVMLYTTELWLRKTFLELCQEGRGNNSIKPSCYYWKALQFLVKNVIGTSTTGKSILTSSWCSNWYGRFLVRAKSCSFILLQTSSLNNWKCSEFCNIFTNHDTIVIWVLENWSENIWFVFQTDQNYSIEGGKFLDRAVAAAECGGKYGIGVKMRRDYQIGFEKTVLYLQTQSRQTGRCLVSQEDYSARGQRMDSNWI